MLGTADVYIPPSSHFDLGTFVKSIHSSSPIRSAMARANLDEHLALAERRKAIEDDARRKRIAARKKKKQRLVIDLTTSLKQAGASLASVETVPVIDLTGEDDDEDECPICQKDLPPPHSAERQTLACQHAFCTACIAQWVEVNPSCPMCRKAVE